MMSGVILLPSQQPTRLRILGGYVKAHVHGQVDDRETGVFEVQ